MNEHFGLFSALCGIFLSLEVGSGSSGVADRSMEGAGHRNGNCLSCPE